MVNESIISVVKQYLQALVEQGIPVHQGVIYGSYAAGQPDIWSDIDLLVVSPRFDEKRNRDDINLLWRVAARTDSRIEPIPVGQQQFKEDDTSAIIEIARREGKVVSLDVARIPESYQGDIDKAVEILKSAGCSKIFLFGSLAANRIKDNSDIDLAIEGCPSGMFFHLLGQLMIELDHPVDLVSLDNRNTFTNYLETEGELLRIG